MFLFYVGKVYFSTYLSVANIFHFKHKENSASTPKQIQEIISFVIVERFSV